MESQYVACVCVKSLKKNVYIAGIVATVADHETLSYCSELGNFRYPVLTNTPYHYFYSAGQLSFLPLQILFVVTYNLYIQSMVVK